MKKMLFSACSLLCLCLAFSNCLKEENLQLNFNTLGITPILIDKILASPSPTFSDEAEVVIHFHIDYTEIPDKERALLKDILVTTQYQKDTLLPLTATSFKSVHKIGAKKNYDFILKNNLNRSYHSAKASFTVSL